MYLTLEHSHKVDLSVSQVTETPSGSADSMG